MGTFDKKAYNRERVARIRAAMSPEEAAEARVAKRAVDAAYRAKRKAKNERALQERQDFLDRLIDGAS